MCNCIKEFEKRLVDEMIKSNGRTITAARFPKAFIFSDGKFKPYIEVEVNLEGLKSSKTLKVFMTYCPFCGQKFD